jgi:Raf kinase inhibitor-like YbhB/YbcL family protein
MLEHLPHALGNALRSVRAGAEKLVVVDTGITGLNASIELTSPAFQYDAPIPKRYTADGEGLSPPLSWSGVPSDAISVALLIEDADSPTGDPLVHAIVWDLPGVDTALPEGALGSHSNDPSAPMMGKNSFLRPTYLAPDPPPGHGPHRYVFQIFALDCVLRFASAPGRHALIERLRDHVVAKGLLIGTYGRE